MSDCVSVSVSEQRRSSFSTAGKHRPEFLVGDGTESEPNRDIELELSALHMEDSEPPGVRSQVRTPDISLWACALWNTMLCIYILIEVYDLYDLID